MFSTTNWMIDEATKFVWVRLTTAIELGLHLLVKKKSTIMSKLASLCDICYVLSMIQSFSAEIIIIIAKFSLFNSQYS